jgi:hypothetical protein
VEWQVWSVVPGTRCDDERRAGFDRRSPDPVLRYTGPERRVSSDRRRAAPALPERLAGGWLIFEGPGERRRLAPIPPHWDRLADHDLERLRERAAPATRLSGPPPDAP